MGAAILLLLHRHISLCIYILVMAVWHSGNGIKCINEVTLHWDQLILGWVTIFWWANHLYM